MENSTNKESSSLTNNETKQKDSKFWGKINFKSFFRFFSKISILWLETLFLSSIAAVGLLIGFSNGISVAKKNDETAFNKVFCLIICFWLDKIIFFPDSIVRV